MQTVRLRLRSFARRRLPALLLTLVGAVAGVLLQQYFLRAKPNLYINLLAFTGVTGDMIAIPSETVRMGREIAWLRPFNRYEPFTAIATQEQEMGKDIAELTSFTGTLTEWMNAVKIQQQTTVSRALLLDHPCFVGTNRLCLMLFHVLVAAGRLRPPILSVPISSEVVFLKKISTSDSQLPGEDASDLTTAQASMAFVASELRARRFLDVWNFYTPAQISAVELIATSFSRGVAENLLYYSEQLNNQANDDLKNLHLVRSSIQQQLLPTARLRVEIQLYNAGGTPICFQPHFALRIHQPEKAITTILLSAQGDEESIKEEAKRNTDWIMPAPIRSMLFPDKGSHIQPEVFLPYSGNATFITVAPNSMRTAVLISRERLGSKGPTVRQYYEAGLLRCQVVGITTENAIVTSSEVQFGRHISEHTRTLFEK